MSIETIIVIAMYSVIAVAVSAVPVIIGAVKKRRVIKPVEYFPPKGFSPLDVMIEYYGASANPREIFNPLMLYWAERGFITIEEDCKRGLKLTKLKDIEPGDNYNPETYEIEKRIFGRIFTGKVFYTLSAGSSFSDFYKQVTDDLHKKAKEVTAVKSKKINIISVVTAFVMFIAAIVTAGVATRQPAMLVMIFPLAAIAMPKLTFMLPADNDGLAKGTAARFLMLPFFALAGGGPFVLVFATMSVSVTITLVVTTVVCVLNVFFFSGKADIRSDEQLKTYAKICGFKQFLLLAEAKQLEMLVEKTPRYYYNILPYCYILGITEKMKPKFDRIVLDGPAWYLGELRETLMF